MPKRRRTGRGVRRSHTRTTKSGPLGLFTRRVKVNRANIAKGKGRPAGGRPLTSSHQKDRLKAAAAFGLAGLWFGIVSGNWVAATFCGLGAVGIGSLYLGSRLVASTRQSRTIARRKAKKALRNMWATIRPHGSQHKLARAGSRPKLREGWATLAAPKPRPASKPAAPAAAPPAADQPEVERQLSPQRRTQRVHGSLRDNRTGKVTETSWLASGDDLCPDHDVFDRDCPTCLASVR